MATYSKQLLSGSTNGRGINIAATATAGTLIHTAVAGTSDLDEIWIYGVNADNSTDQKITLEWGGVTAPDDSIELTITKESGLVLIAPGLLLQNGLVVRGFAGAASDIMIHGYVNRITA